MQTFSAAAAQQLQNFKEKQKICNNKYIVHEWRVTSIPPVEGFFLSKWINMVHNFNRKLNLSQLYHFSSKKNMILYIYSTQSMKKSDFPCHGIITDVFFPNVFFLILYLPVIKKNNVYINVLVFVFKWCSNLTIYIYLFGPNNCTEAIYNIYLWKDYAH